MDTATRWADRSRGSTRGGNRELDAPDLVAVDGTAVVGDEPPVNADDAQARQRYLVQELEKLGHTVTLKPAA